MIDRSLFHVEDFLVDNTFQLYCSGKDKLCTTYWENYILAHPEQQATIAEARRLYIILSGNKKPLNGQLNALKTSMETKVGDDMKPLKNYSWLQIAAAVAILIGVAFFFSKGEREIPAQQLVKHFRTGAGERKKITLSDGTTVLLNSKSSLVLTGDFNGQSREVNLVGEAFFDVKHNKHKPFKVHTTDFDINVLGTAFNVKIYPGEATSEATLIRGLIVMEGKGSKGSLITLKPSQKVTFYKKEAEVAITPKLRKVTPQQPEITINHFTQVNDSIIAEVAWTQNRLEISDQSFAELKGAMERWFNVELKFTDKEVEGYHFTASISNENIDQALKAFQSAQHFKYEIKGNQITISK